MSITNIGKITIKECKPETCDLYSAEGRFIGVIPNYESFNDIRLQVAEKRVRVYKPSDDLLADIQDVKKRLLKMKTKQS